MGRWAWRQPGGGQRHALVWGVARRQTGTGQTWTGGAERPSSMATAVTGRPAARIETPLSVLFTRGNRMTPRVRRGAASENLRSGYQACTGAPC